MKMKWIILAVFVSGCAATQVETIDNGDTVEKHVYLKASGRWWEVYRNIYKKGQEPK